MTRSRGLTNVPAMALVFSTPGPRRAADRPGKQKMLELQALGQMRDDLQARHEEATRGKAGR